MADDLPPGFRIVQQPTTEDVPPGFKIVAPGPAAADAPEKSSTAGDIVKSLGSGVVRGAVETAMLPVTAKRLLDTYATPYEVKAVNAVRGAFGYDPIDAPTPEQIASEPVQNTLNSGQDIVRTIMDDQLHAPETTAGKFAGTIGEFMPPGAWPSKAARLAPTVADKAIRYAEEATGNVLAPALASEAAGQATEGTSYEGPARFLGALFGNTTAAATRAHYAPDAAIRRSTEGMTDADWQRALDLQNNRTGIDLSSPEAAAQARGGASKLPDLLRIVEGSQTGGAVTGPFFAARPAQVDTAVGGVLDKIAPQSAQPSLLGPRAAEVAGNVIDNARQDINAQTRPLYQVAEPQLIPAADFAPIQADPRFQAGLARLRANPELAPDYAGMADNSIAVIDAVTKDMAARGEALANSANPLYGPELAGKNSAGAVAARNVATQQSPEYAQALAEQQRLRRGVLDPVTEGPVGRVAAAKDTAAASNAVLPQNPLTGSGREAADAVQRIAAQDPETAAALVRQNLADRYNAAQTETQGGSRETAGAKFHKSVAGNDARQEVLDAVLNAIPGGQPAAAAMSELLDVLQATMRRKSEGSPTEVNRMNTEELGSASPQARLFDLARTLGASFLTQAGDATKRATLRNSMSSLADILTGPNAVERTRAAADRRPRVSYPEALARTAAEAGQTLDDPRGGRKPLELTVTKKDKRQ